MTVYVLVSGEVGEGESLEDIFYNLVDAKSVIFGVEWTYNERDKCWFAKNPVEHDYPDFWAIREKEIK